MPKSWWCRALAQGFLTSATDEASGFAVVDAARRLRRLFLGAEAELEALWVLSAASELVGVGGRLSGWT